MRELKRSIARNMMKALGVEQINKKKCLNKSNQNVSYFSLHWREYFDPASKISKYVKRVAKSGKRSISRA